ncbi:MAG: hypothetical protein D6801_05555 [Alphaproteobacteria bacterium]|nr:MAG: hypothetical protein D6801_05555 [Alphaproteobacteria bacterium]
MFARKKTLYLHIGTHKTGTTSFQASLRANRGRLAKRGYLPVGIPARKSGIVLKRKTYNVNRIAYAFLRPGIASIGRVASGLYPKPERLARARAEYLEMLRGLRARNLIVSAEAFTFLRTPEEREELQRFLAALGREVKIVLVWREEAAWRASWENQLKKKPKVWKKNRALPDEQRANGEWYFDRQAILDFWTGLGEITEVDYDAALASEGNVIPAIYRAMGIDPAGLKVEFVTNTRVPLEDDDEDN